MAYDRTLLTQAELEQFLKAHPAWRHEGGMLRRTYEARTFLEGIRFVSELAGVAEAHDHHPDIDIRWRKVSLALSTHDAGGLTFRDPRLASEADRLFDQLARAG